MRFKTVTKPAILRVMNTSYPAAEAFARKMRLPVTVCPVTRELYQRTVPTLGIHTAQLMLSAEGIYVGTPAYEAAMAILEARFESYNLNGF